MWSWFWGRVPVNQHLECSGGVGGLEEGSHLLIFLILLLEGPYKQLWELGLMLTASPLHESLVGSRAG